MLEVAMHDSIGVDVSDASGQLRENPAGTSLRELVYALVLHVAYQVPTFAVLGYDKNAVFIGERLDKFIDIRAVLAEVERLNFRDSVRKSQRVVLLQLDCLDRNLKTIHSMEA